MTVGKTDILPIPSRFQCNGLSQNALKFLSPYVKGEIEVLPLLRTPMLLQCNGAYLQRTLTWVYGVI